MSVQSAVIALEILAHLPVPMRGSWFAKAVPEALDAATSSEVTRRLLDAYPRARVAAKPLQDLLANPAGAPRELLDAVVKAMTALHASRKEPDERPYPGRGCDLCRAPCQYAVMLNMAISGQNTLLELLAGPEAFDPSTPAFVAQTAINLALPKAAALRFEARFIADAAYCLVTQLVGLKAGVQELRVLEELQVKYDLLRTPREVSHA